MYRITYIVIKTGQRERYMNNTGFTLLEAEAEIERLQQQQLSYDKTGYGRTRKDFRAEKINFHT